MEYASVEDSVRKLRFQSIGVARGDDKINEEARKLIVLTQMKGFIEFALEPAREGMTQAQLEKMRVVSRRFPFPPSVFRYALALALNRYPKSAIQEMKILRNLHGDKQYEEGKKNLLMMRERHPQLSELDFEQ